MTKILWMTRIFRAYEVIVLSEVSSLDYTTLLLEAEAAGLIVKEKLLLTADGRIKGHKVAIRRDLSLASKLCALAEEMGHYYKNVGDILDQSDVSNRKQEYRARLWAYDKIIGLEGIIRAYKAGCTNRYEMSELLDVPEPFLSEALKVYESKYGISALCGDYRVIFIPVLTVEPQY